MMAMMGIVAENGKPEKSAICIWCDTVLDPAVPHIGRVCSRCYRLLKLAGITEDEIFARDEWADNKDDTEDS